MNSSRKRSATLGNLLLLSGLYLLLFAGGLLADEQYSVYAAQGDLGIGGSTATASAPASIQPQVRGAARMQPSAPGPSLPAIPGAQPEERRQPESNVTGEGSEDQLSNALAAQVSANTPSTVTRIEIPAIKVDRKVVEMGWTVQVQDGQEVQIWDVDKYRVGHHKGTSNPGQGGNIVLSGHSGGWQYPFNDIFYLKPGDLVQLTSNGRVYDYRVSDHILVDEVGQPLEKRLENARYIEPTDAEMITMVACWPLTGPDKFKQRIIIRAKPADGSAGAASLP
ncbi:MAG: sortase [Chloroflexota bacterium]|nr:sortase [Chloroflexota bacterium]